MAGVWKLRGRSVPLEGPIVMGILNTTPDSFADGGRYSGVEEAVSAALDMVASGATIIDVGGESTRPGASLVSLDEELDRVVDVVDQLASQGILVSVDTSKPEVVTAVVEAGAVAINDVTGLETPRMRELCADAGVGVVVMHMEGTPRTMQRDPRYDDVVREVTEYLIDGANAAIEAGVSAESIAIDPGIGFGKTVEHNIELMSNLEAFVDTGFPVVLGTSRKGFLGNILESVRGTTLPSERDGATAATIALAVASGVRILRVHNVPLAVDVAYTANAMVPKDDGKETNRS
ncbi:MAG: dihydropteroate synthase [Actinomycetia bacterium]|nr:dihydropteroate synthase [Actinomycetes bacterium]